MIEFERESGWENISASVRERERETVREGEWVSGERGSVCVREGRREREIKDWQGLWLPGARWWRVLRRLYSLYSREMTMMRPRSPTTPHTVPKTICRDCSYSVLSGWSTITPVIIESTAVIRDNPVIDFNGIF